MNPYLIVFLGAGIGGTARYAANLFVPRVMGGDFPWHTLLINIAGCLVMGLVAGWFAHRGDGSGAWRLFMTTGILGGFTTFSAFSLDAMLLYERGQLSMAALYVLASVLVSLIAVAAGLAIMRSTVA
jgi:CrcB protein